MAAQLGPNDRSGGRGFYRPRMRVMSEINVTPFVDVMLVLLIVFMVTAPLLTVGVPVDLPETQAASINDDVEPIVLSVQRDGRIFLQETPIEMEAIAPRLMAISEARGLSAERLRVYVRGDRDINYGRIVELMGTVSVAGFTRVALLAKLPDRSSDGN